MWKTLKVNIKNLGMWRRNKAPNQTNLLSFMILVHVMTYGKKAHSKTCSDHGFETFMVEIVN